MHSRTAARRCVAWCPRSRSWPGSKPTPEQQQHCGRSSPLGDMNGHSAVCWVLDRVRLVELEGFNDLLAAVVLHEEGQQGHHTGDGGGEPALGIPPRLQTQVEG